VVEWRASPPVYRNALAFLDVYRNAVAAFFVIASATA
jgi:hypothetical protein